MSDQLPEFIGLYDLTKKLGLGDAFTHEQGVQHLQKMNIEPAAYMIANWKGVTKRRPLFNANLLNDDTVKAIIKQQKEKAREKLKAELAALDAEIGG